MLLRAGQRALRQPAQLCSWTDIGMRFKLNAAARAARVGAECAADCRELEGRSAQLTLDV